LGWHKYRQRRLQSLCSPHSRRPGIKPTWSAWELLNVNEYNKRAFQFKALLSVNDSAYNIEISELSVTAQEIA